MVAVLGGLRESGRTLEEKAVIVQEIQISAQRGYSKNKTANIYFFFINGRMAALLSLKCLLLPEICKKKRQRKEGNKRPKRETKIKWNKETDRKRYLQRAVT